MVRILIADDHAVVRIGLRQILQSKSAWTVVGEASNGMDAVEQAALHKPDVVILDYLLPRLNGIDATEQIVKALPRANVLIFTMQDCESVLLGALNAGARGYLLKSEAQALLIDAIKTVATGKYFFSSEVSQHLLEKYLKASDATRSLITPREVDVVTLIALGKKNREIADELDISVKTVETHRATIMRKLNLSSFAGLVRYAVRNKLIAP